MASESVFRWLQRRRGGMTPGGSLTMTAVRRAKSQRRAAEFTEWEREREAAREANGHAEKPATRKGAKTAMTTQVESKEIPGVSQALVDQYGADTLRKLLHPRSAPQFAFVYDRGTARDGANVTMPYSCSRHVADNAKRGWLAIRLMESHADDAVGTQWREVQELPADLRIAGELA